MMTDKEKHNVDMSIIRTNNISLTMILLIICIIFVLLYIILIAHFVKLEKQRGEWEEIILSSDIDKCNEYIHKKFNKDVLIDFELDKLPALSISIAMHDDDLLECLLSMEININQQSLSGNTPLHIAVEYSNAYAVEQLLKHGANRNLFDCQGYTAREIAQFNNDGVIVALFELY